MVAPDSTGPWLSFVNLVEIHVLDALRRGHKISLPKVRRALDYLNHRFPSRHPLAHHLLRTDGLDVFVERYGSLINVTKEGQMAIREMLEAHLGRIEWGPRGIAIRLFPFTRKRRASEPRAVVIDPRIQFGRPVLVGTGVPTAIIAERYKAGESVIDLARDYGRKPNEIEEAIRCELHLAEAA